MLPFLCLECKGFNPKTSFPQQVIHIEVLKNDVDYYIQWDDQGYSDELELEIEFELYFTNLNCKCYPNLYELEL